MAGLQGEPVERRGEDEPGELLGGDVRLVELNRLGASGNGIDVLRVEKWLYVGSGVVAAFAGVVFAARSGVGQVSAGGSTVTLTVISAVLIGGTSLFGGLGKITGTVLGAILFAEIDNALPSPASPRSEATSSSV